MTNIATQLETSLKSDRSEANIRKWVSYIIDHNIALHTMHAVLDAERTVSMRFTWLIGGLCEQAPEIVLPSVAYFYSKRHDVVFANYDRSLAKMFWLAGVPAEIEGAAIDDMFRWLMDANITVSTKTYSMFALHNLTAKYPELKNELKISLEDQLGKSTADFDKRLRKMLESL